MTASAEAVYNETVDLLKKLDEDQLKIVHTILVDMSSSDGPEDSPLGISTDEELWDHIELSLSHAKQRIGRNADNVINDLKKEYAV